MSRSPDRLIDTLDLPSALRGLDAASLRKVAAEVREEIIETISLERRSSRGEPRSGGVDHRPPR